MFSIADRNHVRERVLQHAAQDPRVVSGAVVGSLAVADGDRWSDLDLTFGVADDVSPLDVLEDWTNAIISEFDAARLFDLPSGPSIYRVFLLPGCLQFDLSFTPASQFGATGAKFKLLFGAAVEKAHIQATPAHELFGYAVHHLVRARVCIERCRYWQAEYWVSSARDYVLSLACQRRGLSPFHGRGFDDLPREIREAMTEAIPRELERESLQKAVRAAVEGLLREADEMQELVAKLKPQLRELTER
ncbi:MAG: hypothetical protein ACJ8KU_01520 [Chthoniobacterales bacterium]